MTHPSVLLDGVGACVEIVDRQQGTIVPQHGPRIPQIPTAAVIPQDDFRPPGKPAVPAHRGAHAIRRLAVPVNADHAAVGKLDRHSGVRLCQQRDAESDTATETTADTAESDPTEPTSPQRPPSAFAVLRDRNFARYWYTLVLSLTGTWTRATALGYLAYDLTDSELSLGLISVAASAPVMISSPIAGILLDRLDRTRVLVVVQIVNVLATLAVTLLVALGRAEFWHLLVITRVQK